MAPEDLTLRCRVNPHFSHAEWNCRHPVGGETWDDVELCERFVLGSTSNRESFSPSAFQLGEKVPKADEGAFHEYVIRAPSSALGPASVHRAYLVKRPLIRLRHLKQTGTSWTLTGDIED